ncbi:MAG: LysR family transcriptional regulator [Pseudomonadota bacterium]
MALPDLDLLETFLTVAEHQSISDAARTLELTQPAITKKIKRLEEAVNVTLIDRNTRPLQLTEAGEVLRGRVPALLTEARELMTDMRVLSGRTLPVLRIGMSDTLSEILGAEFVGAMTHYAELVELKSGISPWLETAFRARHFDLAVDSPPFVDTAGLGMSLLFRDPYVVVLPQDMAEKPLDEVFARENYVGYGRSSKFGAAITSTLTRLGVKKPTRFNFDSTQSLLRFVQTGYGWAVTSAFCLLQSPQALKDVTVLPCPQSTPRDFMLLHREGETDAVASEAAARFQSVFGQLAQGPWARNAPIAAEMIRAVNGLETKE